MRLHPFELDEPHTVDEAVDALARAGGEARVIGGGTALVPMLRLGLVRPARLVSLHRVKGLDGLGTDGGGALDVGSMVTMAALSRSALVRDRWPLLAESAGRVASPAIRSTATVGGNLGYAEPASDLAPALLCLDAVVRIAGPSGERTVPLSEFLTGLYETALGPGEVVTGVRVPAPPRQARSAYAKFCPRSAEDKPLVGVAAVLAVEDGGRCADVRIGLGAAAPSPMRAARAESILRGEIPSDDAIRAAADAAAAEADPLSDLMGTADYRRRMVAVWVRRVLTALRDGSPLAGSPGGAPLARLR